MNAFMKIITGQLSLIVCSIIYLIWWSLCYRPNISVSKTSGIHGVLLATIILFGISGAILSLIGTHTLSTINSPKLCEIWIIIGGIIAYIALFLITRFTFARPVTTELLLITVWTMLELEVINVLNAANKLPDVRFWIAIGIIAFAFIFSMVLYILYYRMKPMHAFYAAMLPLITEGLSMVGILALTMIKI